VAWPTKKAPAARATAPAATPKPNQERLGDGSGVWPCPDGASGGGGCWGGDGGGG
jgi:hypothetical protein